MSGTGPRWVPPLLRASFAAVPCGLALALAPSAQSVRLSAPRLLTVGDVTSHVQSPDGQWVVYHADQDTDGVRELYSVPADGSAPPVKLNGASSTGSVAPGPRQVLVTPGSDRVLYCAYHATTGVLTLFSVPIAGGASVQLSGASPVDTSGDVDPFQVSPDGQRVVYSSGFRLYGVPIGGGPSVQLSQLLRVGVFGGALYGSYAIAPDSSRVVFTSDEAFQNVFGLYACPIAGGTPVRLSPAGDAYVGPWAIHLDGTRVVFVSSPSIFQYPARLYCASLEGGRRPVQLAPAHDFITGLQLDPAGERVVFRAGDFGANYELYSARVPPPRLRPSGTPRETRLTPPSAVPRYRIDYVISADRARIVYRAEQDSWDQFELFSVPMDGGASVRLNPALPAAGDVSAFRLASDGLAVLYTADDAADDAFHLFRVPLAGGASLQLSPPQVAGGTLLEFEPCASAARVVYRADQDVDGVVELYSVPEGGGPALRLNPPLHAGLAVQSFRVDPFGRVLYLADQDENEVVELYSVPAAGGTAVQLNGALLPRAALDDVSRFMPDASGASAIYLADEDTDAWPELYSAPLDGSAPAVKLGPPPSFLGAVSSYALMPGGTSLLVLASAGASAGFFTYPLDGSSPPLLIATPPPGRGLGSVAISPAGDRIVYYSVANYDQDLHSATTDGSRVSTRLDDGDELPLWFQIVAGGTRVVYLGAGPGYRLRNIPIDGGTRTEIASVPSGRHIEGVLVTPDLARVVFRADPDIGGVFELFSVPVDGSAPPVKLSTPLPAGGEVFETFALSADGTRAAYAARQAALQLFSVPVDGSAAPTQLSGTLALQQNGYGAPIFQVSSTGRVVFVRQGGRELYSAPIDGSSAPVLLSAPMVDGGQLHTGSWTPFEIAPDGLQVAYVATQDTADQFELYAAPIDGSSAPVKLSPALAPGRYVLADQITNGRGSGLHFRADGQRVVYVIGGYAAGLPLRELYDSPIDASEPARRLHPALVTGGGVQYADVLGNQALYLADQDQEEVVELYACELGD